VAQVDAVQEHAFARRQILEGAETTEDGQKVLLLGLFLLDLYEYTGAGFVSGTVMILCGKAVARTESLLSRKSIF
jgi:hypothetical protein